MKKQQGYTITEVMVATVVLIALFVVAIVAFGCGEPQSWEGDEVSIMTTESQSVYKPSQASQVCLSFCANQQYDSCDNCEFDVCFDERLSCRQLCGQNCQTTELKHVYNCVMEANSIQERNDCVIDYCENSKECAPSDSMSKAYHKYFCEEGRFF